MHFYLLRVYFFIENLRSDKVIRVNSHDDIQGLRQMTIVLSITIDSSEQLLCLSFRQLFG